MVHTTVNEGIDTLTNWHTSSSGDKRGSTDNLYKDWLNDMRVNFYETADYGMDWAGGGSGVDVETTFPASPSSGVAFMRKNTVTGITRFYTYDGANWSVVGNEDKKTDFNGTVLESFDLTVSSDGATITASLEKTGTGDLTLRLSDGYTTLVTPPMTKTLTPGTAIVPKTNYLYILQSDKTQITLSTTGFPTDVEHVKIAFVCVFTAAITQTDGGALINQNWNDHATNNILMGHIAHIEQWIRTQPASYVSGIDGDSATGDDYLDITTGPDAVHFVSQAGVVSQLHFHDYDAIDTSGSEFIYVVNDPDAAYTKISELIAGVDKLSDGTPISNNRYFNVIFWGVANKSGEVHATMCNLPSKQYTILADAQQDIDGGDNFTIPREFNIESSTGFLICRLTVQLVGSTWVYHSTTDLRGLTPQTASGGGTGGAGSDSTAIHNNVVAEISAIANKATPIGADFLLIEDSAASDAKKHITITNLEAILIHNNLAGIDDGDVNHLTDDQVTDLHAIYVLTQAKIEAEVGAHTSTLAALDTSMTGAQLDDLLAFGSGNPILIPTVHMGQNPDTGTGISWRAGDAILNQGSQDGAWAFKIIYPSDLGGLSLTITDVQFTIMDADSDDKITRVRLFASDGDVAIDNIYDSGIVSLQTAGLKNTGDELNAMTNKDTTGYFEIIVLLNMQMTSSDHLKIGSPSVIGYYS